MPKFPIFIAAVIFVLPTAASADETYCQSNTVPLYDGADHNVDWTVTTTKARKPQKWDR